MRHHPLTESAQFFRAAKHLIRNHGSRAAAIAIKRAAYLHQCGEAAGADTWRKIGEFVRTIESGSTHAPARKTTVSAEPAIGASAARDIPTAAPADIMQAAEICSLDPSRSATGAEVSPS